MQYFVSQLLYQIDSKVRSKTICIFDIKIGRIRAVTDRVDTESVGSSLESSDFALNQLGLGHGRLC